MRTERACAIGEQWFTERRPGERWFTTAGDPACLINGRPTELADGYKRAAEILSNARHPLVFGLAGVTCEAVRAAVALADRLGASIDPADPASAALTTAIQSHGIVTATLGEVRHRTDLIVFWHVDPATTHPRHFERYSLTCASRFAPGGRADRFCVVVDHEPTATAAEADLFLQIAPGSDATALAALRELLVGEKKHAADGNDDYRSKMNRLCDETGAPVAEWQQLVDRMKAARYTALFFDPGRGTLTPALSQRERGQAGVLESLLKLAHSMNDKSRLVVVPMGSAGNANGAEQVLTWQTGYPHSVSFAAGYPQCDPQQYSAEAMLSGGEADAALVVDAAAVASLSEAARAHLAAIPNIVLSARQAAASSSAAVAFRVAVPGIETGGTVFRVDGVPLPLRPALASRHPAAEVVLAEITSRI